MGGRAVITAGDDSVRPALDRVFRTSPVAVDDPALRPSGSSGPVMLPPGSLSWFVSAARVRSGEEGLRVRLVPEGSVAKGFDPAGTYRPFVEALESWERVAASSADTV